NATTTLRKVSATGQTISTYPLSGANIRAIAWDPNRKGFWFCDFGGNIVCRDTANTNKGTIVSTIPGKYGLAFDSSGGVGSVWAWSQVTGGLQAELVQYNAATGAVMNTYTFNYTALNVGIAGGAEIQEIDGKIMLLLNFQNQAVVGYKIADATGGGGSLCFNRTGLNLVMPDNSPVGVRDTIKVTNNTGTIDDITVVIDDIQSTWIGDLVALLDHGGETDTLFSRIGTGTFGNSSDNLTNVRFTDSAAAPIAGIGNAINPSNGSWLPGGRTGVDSLRPHFVGQDISGNWQLYVTDNAAGDPNQTLNAWSICFYSGNITQIISNSSETPDRYTLGQNYPNPFNPTTKINFSIPKAGLVSLKVYDM